MSFPLSTELIDQIVFGMENQTTNFYLDLERMTVVPETRMLGPESGQGPAGAAAGAAAGGSAGGSLGDNSPAVYPAPSGTETNSRFVQLPPWASADGFQLMERFAVTLRNPLVHRELLRILSSGKGVFRQFKDCLKQYPGVEKLWLGYKKTEMRDVVLSWFAEMEESQGLEFEYPEFDDVEDLIRSDFRLIFGDYAAFAAAANAPDAASAAAELELLLRDAWQDMAATAGQSDSGAVLAEASLQGLREGNMIAALLFSLDGQAAALILAARVGALPLLRPAGLEVNMLYTRPEYRGLRAASFLLEQLPSLARARGLGAVSISIPASVSYLRHVCERLGYEPGAQVFSR